MFPEFPHRNCQTAFNTHVAIRYGLKEVDVIEVSVNHMSFLGHHFDKAVRVATFRTYQPDLRSAFRERSFHARQFITQPKGLPDFK